MEYYVLIPAYKPDNRLILLIEELQAASLKVLVVDDGSGKDYSQIFSSVRSLDVEVVSYPDNRGKGSALKTGLKRLKEMGNVGGVVTADADGQHLPADILKVMDALKADPQAFVLGVRRFAAKHVPLRSKIGNWITKIAFYMVSGIHVSDTQTGLRGMHSSLFDILISLEGERYEYEMDMLLNLKSWPVHVVEVPINTVYIDGNKGSSFNSFKDAFCIFKRLIRFSASSLTSAVVDYAVYYALCLAFPVVPFIPANIIQPAAIWLVCARIISSALNYSINRYFVFKKNSPGSLWKFALLAGCVMLVSAFGIDILVGVGVGYLLSKILVDTPMFFVNYYFQNKFIFTKSA